MTRQIYQNIGLLVAIIIASVSLPIGIIGFMRNPIINNYYEDNYYSYNYYSYYNQTYYGENETEPYYPPENVTYNNLINDTDWFHHRVYNLTGNHIITWWFNRTNTNQLGVWIIQDYLFDWWLEDNSSHFYHNDIFGGSLIFKKEWNVPFSNTWHVYFRYWHTSDPGLNITITTMINNAT